MDARRPLVFLCGPFYTGNKSDRREILKRYISQNWKRKSNDDSDYIHAFPIIVDNLFKPDVLSSEWPDIKINTLEEIVANISYKTYIFLDTMSTSYELGQFTNFAYDKENVSVFLDDQYKYRINNSIGGYLESSFKGKLIEYDASYNNKGHIFFPKKGKNRYRMPDMIASILKQDNPILSTNTFYKTISFSLKKEEVNEFGTIICDKKGNQLSFNFSIKNLFYFVSSVYRLTFGSNRGQRIETPVGINDECFNLFLNNVKKELLTTFVVLSNSNANRSYILSDDFEVDIGVGDLNSKELIYHIFCMSHLLFNYKGTINYVVKEIETVREGILFTDNEASLLSVVDKHLEKILEKKTEDTFSLAVRRRKIKIRKKSRLITCYANNYFGRQLQYIHNEILNSFLKYLPTSPHSYAYKEGLNTLKCIEKHRGNMFFAKYDIHKYFDSILFSALKQKLVKFIKYQCKKKLKNVFSNGMRNTISQDVARIIKPLFINYQLPIGFVCSPKISDFYLYELDEKMGGIKNVTYTRYADDILLSSNDSNSLEKAEIILQLLIKKEKLILNYFKTRKRALIQSGDSFKFLGINIVKRNSNKFELTIGKRYLNQTSKMCCNYFSGQNNQRKPEDYYKIIGRISYIKAISEKSFKQFLKIIKKKATNFSIIESSLHNSGI